MAVTSESHESEAASRDATRPRPGTRSVPAASSQGKRRALYGLNVAVAVAAAVLLVVLVNAAVDYGYRHAPPAWRSWVRYDLTATRSQTLSPQTRRVLRSLGRDVRLVAVMRVNDASAQEAADLIAEYARYSNRVDAEFIHPDRDTERLASLYSSLQGRFADEVDPLRGAVVAGLDTLDAVRGELGAMAERFFGLAESAELADGPVKDRLLVLGTGLADTHDSYTRAGEQLRANVDSALPLWDAARNDLATAFRRLDAEVLGPFRRAVRPVADSRDAPMAVRDGILELDARVQDLQARLTPAVEALLAPGGTPRYGRVVTGLSSGEAVVVLGEGRERVVPIGEMFAAAADGEEAARVFVGEDRLTGALLTMSLDRPPRVVFVRDSPVSVFGERGQYRHVAERLLRQDFELAEWSVGGGGGAGGAGGAGTENGGGSAVVPPPLPGGGSAVVWVVPPLDLQRTSAADRERVAAVLGERLAAGDGVMLTFGYDPDARVRAADPLAELAARWGVGVDRHGVVLHEDVGQDRRRRASPAAEVDRWPVASPLAGALAGRTGVFVMASPVELDAVPGVEVMPLVELASPRQWVATGLATQEAVVAAPYDPAAAADAVVIAAAAEREGDVAGGAGGVKGGGRLIAFGETHWATDNLAARNLGNSEMFINSVYWLAHLDDAIAATARTQDVRRIGPVSDDASLTLRLALLAGLPGLALGLGVAVWAVRRRG